MASLPSLWSMTGPILHQGETTPPTCQGIGLEKNQCFTGAGQIHLLIGMALFYKVINLSLTAEQLHLLTGI